MLTAQNPTIADQLELQQKLRSELIKINVQVKKQPKAKQKNEELQKILSDGLYKDLSAHYFCLAPEYYIKKFRPQECRAFKSAMAPLLLSFDSTKTIKEGIDPVTEEAVYKVIFKNGDDLRQDQLILQIIALMDDLLKNVNIDMKLTPYKAMAWSKEDGVLECILGSKTLQEVLQKTGDNLDLHFKELAKAAATNFASWFYQELGMSPEQVKREIETEKGRAAAFEDQAYHKILDNYIDSCAGYCVITYILGIGDRHLENLMLTEQGNYDNDHTPSNPYTCPLIGKFAHIDFGFILGKDPKIFPPPFKLCKPMVEGNMQGLLAANLNFSSGMGGQKSPGYENFKRKCVQTFIYLRKYSKLIINLFQLMLDSGLKVLFKKGIENNSNIHRILMLKALKNFMKSLFLKKVTKTLKRCSWISLLKVSTLFSVYFSIECIFGLAIGNKIVSLFLIGSLYTKYDSFCPEL